MTSAPAPLDRVQAAAAAQSTQAPLLCLHGLFAGRWVFDNLIALAAARGRPATALSFRNHPPNAPASLIGRTTIGDYCDDASDAARGLDQPIVVGHSLGGLVALMLVARNLACAAVLVSPAPPRGISVLSPGILVRMIRYLPALVLSRAFLPRAQDLDAMVLNVVPVEERAALRRQFVPDSGRAARQAALGVVKVPPSAVRAPLLVVGAENDRFIPASVSERVARMYGAPFHLARGHGHFLFAEPGWQSQARVMLDWIDTLPCSARDSSFEAGLRTPRSNSEVG